MHTPEEIESVPLASDEAITERVGELVGPALKRQLWMMFLNDKDVQLPILIPVDDYPLAPDRDGGDLLARSFARIMETTAATQVIVVWERHLGPGVTPPDRAWAMALAEACRERGIRLRAQLISHVSGVRWLAPDDYLASVA